MASSPSKRSNRSTSASDVSIPGSTKAGSLETPIEPSLGRKRSHDGRTSKEKLESDHAKRPRLASPQTDRLCTERSSHSQSDCEIEPCQSESGSDSTISEEVYADNEDTITDWKWSERTGEWVIISPVEAVSLPSLPDHTLRSRQIHADAWTDRRTDLRLTMVEAVRLIAEIPSC